MPTRIQTQDLADNSVSIDKLAVAAKGSIITYDTDTTTLPVGSDGQVLTADSSQAKGIKWATAPSPATTKGDLIGYSTVSVRIPVGSNNQVLTADSTQATGIKWANLPSFADSEVPSGTINGVNITFTLANTPVNGSVHLYKNGLRQAPGVSADYTISNAAITFVAGNVPQTGDILLADYRY